MSGPPGALVLVPRTRSPSDARSLLLETDTPVLSAERIRDVSREFQMLEVEDLRARRSVHTALLECNRNKNRYCNVVPYDDTRVVLSGGACSDYINASFIDGEGEGTENAYIATQGPLPHTLADFWRMVWETSAAIIVMLGRERENSRVKVDRYWPSFLDQEERYGAILVKLLSQTDMSDAAVIRRVMHVTMGGETRTVTQYQYSGWPDHGVPKTTLHIRGLMRLLHESHGRSAAPTWPPLGRSALPRPAVVHCSAGIGRTGTFCAIHMALDSLLEQCARGLERGVAVDVFGTVARLRRQRAGMVQQLEQYVFCYNAVIEEAAEMGLEPLPQGVMSPTPKRARTPPGQDAQDDEGAGAGLAGPVALQSREEAGATLPFAWVPTAIPAAAPQQDLPSLR
eukprot:m51a1_g11057 putative protein-tyrosine phosphatase 1 (398) ;mRNA; f:517831-519572